jgi:predicted ribosome quality control (RQC) complex YloA/Tae2 family protein
VFGQAVDDTQGVKGVYEIKFSADTIQYRAALVLFEDGSGAMRVRFQDEGTKVVEQSVTVDSTTYGISIEGKNPVYPGTSIKFPSYDANDLYLSENEMSKSSTKNSEEDRSTLATIQKIEGEIETSHFLFFFNWKLGPLQ